MTQPLRYSYVALSLFLVLILQITGQAQRVRWRYVSTIYDGVKIYLDERIVTAKNKHKIVWDKRVKMGGAVAVSQVDWDCVNKRSKILEMVLYRADQSLIRSTKKFEWQNLVPGTISEILFQQICKAKPRLRYVEIIIDSAGLFAGPLDNGTPLRIATKGSRFVLVEGTGPGGWYNIVDARTQNDYWVHGNNIKITGSK